MEQSKEGSSTLPNTNEKRTFGSPSAMVANFFLHLFNFIIFFIYKNHIIIIIIVYFIYHHQ